MNAFYGLMRIDEMNTLWWWCMLGWIELGIECQKYIESYDKNILFFCELYEYGHFYKGSILYSVMIHWCRDFSVKSS